MGKVNKRTMKLKTQYRLIKIATYTALAIGLAIAIPTNVKRVKAENENFVPYNYELQMDVTAYCLEGTTADGSATREGICAGKPEWLGEGYVAVVYDNDWEFLGMYEVKDTGGERIKKGKTLDIWLPTHEECIEFGRKKDCHVFLVKSYG